MSEKEQSRDGEMINAIEQLDIEDLIIWGLETESPTKDNRVYEVEAVEGEDLVLRNILGNRKRVTFVRGFRRITDDDFAADLQETNSMEQLRSLFLAENPGTIVSSEILEFLERNNFYTRYSGLALVQGLETVATGLRFRLEFPEEKWTESPQLFLQKINQTNEMNSHAAMEKWNPKYRWHSAPMWLKKRCRAYLRRLNRPIHQVDFCDRDVVAKTFGAILGSGSFLDHYGSIPSATKGLPTFFVQPYGNNQKSAEKVAEALNLRLTVEAGVWHPDTTMFLFDDPKS